MTSWLEDERREDDVEERPTSFEPGEILQCRVEKVLDYGAILGVLQSGVPTERGLLHISKIVEDYVEDTRDYLEEGDIIEAMVIPGADGKLSLSTKPLGGLERKDNKPPPVALYSPGVLEKLSTVRNKLVDAMSIIADLEKRIKNWER